MHELYSQMFKDRFTNQLEAEYAIQGAPNASERLSIWKEVAKRSFRDEDDETKEVVKAEMEKRLNTQQASDNDVQGPQEYLK